MIPLNSRYNTDGLNSLNYNLTSKLLEPLYTNISVKLVKSEAKKTVKQETVESKREKL